MLIFGIFLLEKIKKDDFTKLENTLKERRKNEIIYIKSQQ